MNSKIVVAALLLGLGGGFMIAKHFYPTTKTEIKEVEVIKKDIVTIVKTITRPDGTKEETSTTTDRSTERNTSTYSKVDKTDRYMVSGLARIQSYGQQPVYGAIAQMRVVGPLWVGLTADTDKQVGAIVSYSF